MGQNNVIRVRDLTIGAGMPKIIVPIVGRTEEEVLRQARLLAAEPGVDAAEWRVDHFDHVWETERVLALLGQLHGVLGTIPVLFTFRTQKEGGEKPAEKEAYYALNVAAARSGKADLVDVEVFTADDVAEHIAQLQACGVKVIGSRHDFDRTPPDEEMTAWLERGWNLGADIPKLAVMPRCREDVERLLRVTRQLHTRYDRPLITISMSELGVDSRIRGEISGSAMTFGALGQTSAPGQMSVQALRRELEQIHQTMQ